MKKWIVLFLLAVPAIGIGYMALTMDDRNAAVAAEIVSQPDGERARKSMLIYLEDGRMYPVNYLWEDNMVYMGIDGRWWRAFKAPGAPVRMLIRGEEYTGHATAVLDDQQRTDDVFSRLRPTAPEWLPAWLNGKLVAIEITTE